MRIASRSNASRRSLSPTGEEPQSVGDRLRRRVVAMSRACRALGVALAAGRRSRATLLPGPVAPVTTLRAHQTAETPATRPDPGVPAIGASTGALAADATPPIEATAPAIQPLAFVAAPSSTRRDELTSEVTARLSRVCGHFADAAFAALVRDVVDSTMQYEGTASPVRQPWVRPAAADPDRGVADGRHA